MQYHPHFHCTDENSNSDLYIIIFYNTTWLKTIWYLVSEFCKIQRCFVAEQFVSAALFSSSRAHHCSFRVGHQFAANKFQNGSPIQWYLTSELAAIHCHWMSEQCSNSMSHNSREAHSKSPLSKVGHHFNVTQVHSGALILSRLLPL